MPFINGLEISDATGRAVIDLNAALPVPPGKSALGGMLYNNVAGIGRLQVDDSGSPAPFSSVGGFLFNANGQLQILQSLPGGAPLFVNGIRVGPLGGVAISAGGPIAGYVHGWPVTIDGALCIDAGGPVVQTVNWNPADKATNVSLSNGDLTATGLSTTLSLVRANVSRSSGKYYFEGKRNELSSGYPYLGICDGALALSSSTGNAQAGNFAVNANNFFCYGPAGINANTGQTWADEDVMMVAADLTALKIWFGRNGVWFNSGNPAAGTGQIFTLPAGVTWFPMVNVRAASISLTARFAAASWGFAAPSGFQEWGLAPQALRAFSEAFSEGFA